MVHNVLRDGVLVTEVTSRLVPHDAVVTRGLFFVSAVSSLGTTAVLAPWRRQRYH